MIKELTNITPNATIVIDNISSPYIADDGELFDVYIGISATSLCSAHLLISDDSYDTYGTCDLKELTSQTNMYALHLSFSGYTYSRLEPEYRTVNIIMSAYTCGELSGVTEITINQRGCTDITYTVTFDTLGHGTAPEQQTVQSGSMATEPQAPTAEGYTFIGWFTESSCINTYDFNSEVNNNITLYAKWEQTSIEPLTFTALEDNSTLAIFDVMEDYYIEPVPIGVNLDVSTDGGKTWSSWDASSITVNRNKTVLVRGLNPTGFSSNDRTYSFRMTGSFNVSGNIMSLINYSQAIDIIPCSRCFSGLFWQCSSLVSAKYLSLPSNTLKTYCYASLFSECTGLIDGMEELPALNLSQRCYAGMFYDCTSLKTVPIIRANTMSDSCCYNMFGNCIELEQVPNNMLQATQLATGCYYDMFTNCKKLLAAPELPAQTLVTNCYYRMFERCSKLNYIKCLATDVSPVDCIRQWVEGVSSVGTFVGVSYKRIYDIFEIDNTSGIPIGWTPYVVFSSLQDNTSVQVYGYGPHQETLEYTKTPENIASWKEFVEYDEVVTLQSGDILCVRGILTGDNTNTSQTRINIFEGKMSIKGNINNLWNYENTNQQLYNFCGTNLFESSEGLVDASKLQLPSSILSTSCYARMFFECTNLIAAPKLPAMEISSACYYGMFSGCTSLTTAPDLPAVTLKNNCYSNMFEHCISLTKAPDLKAKTLVYCCYYEMFEGCSNLNYIKCLATENIGKHQSTNRWTRGVSSNGTFVKDPSIGTSGVEPDWSINGSPSVSGPDPGIPTNWEILDSN